MSIHYLLNNGQFAARPLATPDDKLEETLRASIAREEKRKMAHEDLYSAIEKRRSELLEDLTRMRSERDAYVANVNAKIKMAQDALDTLPVPRPRKQFKGRKPRAATSNPATALGHE